MRRLYRRQIKFWWQRLTRGFADNETWNLDVAFAKLIAPRLRRFRDISIAYPSDLTVDEWFADLSKMIWAFEFIASEKNITNDYQEANIQEGLDLFAKHYQSLWW